MRDLSVETRALFQGKLAGLYNYPGAETAYDALAADKQEPLGLISNRLESLGMSILISTARWGSVLSTTQHLIYERFGKFRPHYRMMKALIAGKRV